MYAITEFIGFSAALLTTASFIPQAIKVYRTHQTADLSLGMFALFTLGVALWLVYGMLSHAFPVMIANMITLILAMYILIMKLRYG